MEGPSQVEADAPFFRLRTLGSAGLDRVPLNGPPAQVLGPGKSFALLVYLALAPRRSASRPLLADLLWGNVDPVRARQTLRQTLSQLRATLGATAISTRGSTVTLDGPLVVDAESFGEAIRDGRHEEAVSLYAGTFLADFSVPGGDAFEDWVTAERLRLRDAFGVALECLARSRADEGRVREAAALARELRDLSPLSQHGWRVLIEMLLAGGDALAARIEVDSLARLNAEEGRTMEPATDALIRRARTSRLPEPRRGLDHAPELIGREAPLANLVALWEQLRSGSARSATVVAGPGLGKTRLLRDFARRLEARGGTALYVVAACGERHVTYALAGAVALALGESRGAAGVSQASARTLVALAPALARAYAVVPDPLPADAAGVRRAASALLELARVLSDERPIALLVDDLHWGDAASRSALATVLARLDRERVLIVTAERQSAATPLLGGRGAELVLAPLTVRQVGAMLSSIARVEMLGRPDEIIETLQAGASGSPLMVLEALRIAREERVLTVEDVGWRCPNVDALLDLWRREIGFRRRVLHLDGAAREVLGAAALAGRPLPAGVLAEASGVTVTELAAISDALERRGLLASSPAGLTVTHDRIGEVVAENAAPHDVIATHRRLGEALLAASEVSRVMLQQAAGHFVDGAAESMLGPLFLRWRRDARLHGDPRSDRQLAEALLGRNASVRRIRQMLAARPLLSRTLSAARRPAMATLMAVGAALAVTGVIAARPRAVRLALLVPSLAGTMDIGLVPPPVLAIRDQYGRVMRDRSDTIRVTVFSGTVTLRGDTAVVASGGTATFRNVQLVGLTDAVVLRFSDPGLSPVLDTLAADTLGGLGLFLVHARVNQQRLTPSHRTVQVQPGRSIRGTAVLRYDSNWPAASIMLGAFPMWGNRRTSYLTLGPLVTPARGLLRRVTFTLTAPATPGCYPLVFAFQAEGNAGQIASGTNWTVGHLLWNHGNDVTDWTNPQLAAADSTGVVRATYLRRAGGRLVRGVHDVGATVIEVAVSQRGVFAPVACTAP